MNSTGTPTDVKSGRIAKGFQKIDFSTADIGDSFEVFATEVAVVPNAGNHDSGSSKVRLHNIVDYTWEERFYTGQLLAVHMSGIYIAYGLKASSKTAGNVRVVNRQTDVRTLIKGLEGAVQDISFSHIPQEVILACVDVSGNLFIHKVVEETKPVPRLVCELLLHILPDDSYIPQPGDFYRVIWCPYIPDLPDPEDEAPDHQEEVCWLLALSRGKKVELWNVKMVTDRYGSGPVKCGLVEIGYLEIIEHTKPIVDATFAPDGTAIATASLDGDIKFFQVYMQNGRKPRCLHQWKPHRGEPVSSLFFLDNHKNYNPEIQFWKFAITGANNNSELKVWSCESWTCLQTLAFQVRPDRQIKLNAGLDLTSGYLVLSDFHHKILYVLQLYTNNSETHAAIISISEFLLPYPILSFGIVEAGEQRFKSDNLEEICEDENDEESALGVLVKMYLVQPKSLQDCQVAFMPPKPGSINRSELLLEDQLMYPDTLSDMDVNISNGDLNSSNPNLQELPANHSSLQLNLMTPDAFNSPVKHDSSGSTMINKSLTEETSYSNSTTLVASPHSPDETDNHLLTGGTKRAIAMGFASGGSSPSREVQEILAEGKCFYQEADDIQQEQEQVSPTEQKPVADVWPEIPMLRANEVIKNEEQARRSVIQGDCNAVGDNELWKINQRLETSISSMIRVMNSLLQAFEEQAAEVKHLREEIHQLNLVREIDKIVTHNTQTQTLQLENIFASKDNKHQQEALAANISQSVISFLSTQFFDSVNNDISKSVIPAVMNQIEALKHQVNVELTQKLSTTDHLLKENISKLVHSQSVMDVLSSAVVSAITPVITQCFKEYFSIVILPGFEKSCSTMFNQINDVFSKGSKEFIGNLDAQTRRVLDKNNDQSTQLQAIAEMLKNSTNQMSSDLMKNVANIEKHILEAVTRALTLQQATLEGSVIAAVRSRAVTPAPHVIDTQLQQTQLLQLISQGQVNTAFQQALSASDLGLVVFICENVNPQQLFSQVPCPLQQHVLLSLVQQLSADMNNHTEIKHKYLEEALMNLDVNNSVSREHLPSVLNNLQRQLQMYIANNPNNRITRSLKLLLMASQSLLSCTVTNSR